MTESKAEPSIEPQITTASLKAELRALRERAEADPFSNPIVLFAINLSRRLDHGEVAIQDLDRITRKLTVEAFGDRASRLGAYLGETNLAANQASISAALRQLADRLDFKQFRAIIERPAFGIVLTAHPTFSMPLSIARSLAELASGTTRYGEPLDAAGRLERLDAAYAEDHRPPERLTLEVEHLWSVEALGHVHAALEELNRAVFTTAQAKWPKQSAKLTPRLITLASWVGYDQDGRTDVTSMRSFAMRLADKRAALTRYQAITARIAHEATASLMAALAPITATVARATTTVEREAALLAEAERDPRRMPEFSRAMVKGRGDALVETGPLLRLIDLALSHADHEACRMNLLVLRTALRSHGVGLAHIHVRLNASQLHNAIRRAIGLDTEPNDPSNRRSYVNRINDLLSVVKPVAINFADLMTEQASARRLMMTVAQMLKYVDAGTPIRFLIAETETGFTLLTALYYARLYGVEQQVEISPLFETEEAFERGERVIEEALKSPHYREYLLKLGRIAVQFGYSDSGRFLGQMAATFKIERLRLRLAQLLERHGLGALEVLLFNTHGESIGRGCHPNTLDDRLHYLAPAPSRAEFSNRGIRVREEASFQGGDGFVPLLTPATALAVVARVVDFCFPDHPETAEDPIYLAPDYATEFFATVQQEFTSLLADPNYAALLGLYGTNMLYRTGSRPPARESEERRRINRIERPAQLRAIPNNAILQQLGFLANTLYGLGCAASKDPEMFSVMRARSSRFRRALDLAIAALEFSDLDVMRSYTHVFDPGLWLINSGRARNATRAKALRELAVLTERLAYHDSIAGIIRRIQSDYLLLLKLLRPSDSPRRERVILLHALKIALMHHIALLATGIPPFSPQQDVTRDAVQAQILELDVPGAIKLLTRIFPIQEGSNNDEDFGEESSYQPEARLSYAFEHRTVFEPLIRLYELVRSIGSALNHDLGAVG